MLNQTLAFMQRAATRFLRHASLLACQQSYGAGDLAFAPASAGSGPGR